MSKIFYNIIKTIAITLIFSIFFSLIACHKKEGENTIRVGTIAGPETELMAIAKQVALKEYGLTILIVTFNDYNLPNMALDEGSLDANVFQHQAYLDRSIAEHGFHLHALGKTFIYPMAIYSKKITDLSQIHPNAVVTIPNDPTNETRALLLLQEAHLIKLKKIEKDTFTPLDILSNPLDLKIKELDAALLTRTLDDADLSVINTNYAVPAGLLPKKNGLFLESGASRYANIIVVRSSEMDKLIFKQLKAVLHSSQVQKAAKDIFHGAAIPAWDTQ